ncbi:hypothetical protein K431DRAFT_235973 [Polychaeton citri CBS 116435]|uniref:Uncharacterized protein n=1 Tax=Polychaeton citri CBS 116435 TaxID=1314669 RepID=A0A9P4UJX4_9PEZI|nr:hypothetical protein K431DRAFT_235973 [Polychaeton citri CBS 116435]
MAVPATTRETTSQTLDLLEERLRRVDYLINGNVVPTEQNDHLSRRQTETQLSATTRLRNLTRILDHLASKHPSVSHILDLQKRRPELFGRTQAAASTSALSTPVLTEIVLAHEQTYRHLSAQLQQLQAFDIPDPERSANLFKQRGKIDQVRVKQIEQAKEVQELRSRSARVLEEWYEGGVLGIGDMWAQLEASIKACEIMIRRVEAAKEREEGEGGV